MTQRTFTRDDLEQMASATIAASPFPEATISSPCPATGQTVTVTAGTDGVQAVHPAEAVVSAILTGDWDDIRGTVCDLGTFYASADAAASWAAEHPDGVLLTVPDAFHYARSCMRPILDG